MAIKINFLEINNTSYDQVIAQFGFFILIFQSYIISNIFSRIINKKFNKKKTINFYILYSILIKITLKIIKIFLAENNFSNHIIHQSKIIFLISFSGYFLTQCNYIIPILFHTYFFLKNNLLEDNFKKITKYFFYIALVKTLCEYYQIFFLEYFRIFLYENAFFFNIIRQESNIIYTYIHMLSFIYNLYLIYFISKINEINKKLDYFTLNESNNQKEKNIKKEYYFYLNKNNIIYLTEKNQSIENFMLDISFESIKKKINISKEYFLIEKNKNFTLEKSTHLKKKDIEIFLKNNDFILYDQLNEIKETTLLLYNENEIAFEKKLIINIVDHLNKENIRLIYPLKKNEEIEGLIILYKDSFSQNNFLNNTEINEIYPYFKKIFYYYGEKIDQSLYTQLEYEKKISELEIIDISSREKTIYESINKKIKEIETIIIYENQKTISCINTKEVNWLIENLKKDHLEKISEKNNSYLEIKKYQNLISNYDKSIITNNNKISLTSKNHLSFYVILPFLENNVSNSNLISLYKNNLIKNIITIQKKSCIDYIDFLNNFDLGFRIKIIFCEEFNSQSFIKILQYKIKNFFIIDAINKNFINQIIEKVNINNNKKNEFNHFFLKNFDRIKIEYQNDFLFWYKKYFLQTINEYFKCYIIIDKEEKKKSLSEKLLFFCEIIKLEKIPLSLFNSEERILLLKNYFLIIEKKIISEKDLTECLQEKIKIESMHHFIDTTSKKIEFYKNKFYQNHFILDAIKLGKKSLRNIFLMNKIKHQFANKKKIASLLALNRSTISRFFKNKH